MFPMEKAIWNLLKNSIYYDNEIVLPLIRRLTSQDETPCITIQQASEVYISGKRIPNANEIIELKNNAEVWINIWCDTEEQRNSLVNQVETRIFQALANHYTTCARYDDGDCTFLEKECATRNVTNGRTAKCQCPYPNDYDYCSWFKQNQIIKRTFAITGKQDMDELDLAKPVLRTIIKVGMNYYKCYNVGGHEIGNLIVNEELL